jgi:hypothetical protein
MNLPRWIFVPVLALTLTAAGSAWGADTAPERLASMDDVRVRDFVVFPGYGRVPNDNVVLDADGTTLRAHIPAANVRVCDESVVDYSDSTHPKTVCTTSHVEAVPARDLATPAAYTTTVCARENVDYSDSTHPKTTCLEWRTVERTYPPEYRVEVFPPWDYRKEAGRYELRTETRDAGAGSPQVHSPGSIDGSAFKAARGVDSPRFARDPDGTRIAP